MAHPHHSTGLHGPKVWAVCLIAGLAAGVLTALAVPGQTLPGGAPALEVWMLAPFAALLLSIAVMPLVRPRFWHDHFPDFAFGLGGVTIGYILTAFRTPLPGGGMPVGAYAMLHAGLEYVGFMALVGGLYIVSGGIVVRVNARGRPAVNTALLLVGALLANLVGTTGASMLLIRPFMRINRGRLRPLHVVMFIFVVSNCGGCLTPIGDPPLYLGFLKGVPFAWTMANLWPNWLLVNVPLLAVFFAYDTLVGPGRRGNPPRRGARLVQIHGGAGLVCLLLMVAGVFIDPMLRRFAGIAAGGDGLPIGAVFQIVVALASLRLTPRSIFRANRFTFFPVKEVGLLFFGIFATMVPALGYLALRGPSLGIHSPTQLYFTTGGLSAVLDNAPTYLNFLAIAVAPDPVGRETIAALISTPVGIRQLDAVSCGAVFFGAMTYIGNGPNFMVKSIAETRGVAMPGFFAYLGWASLILLPVLVLNWLVLIR